MMGQPLKCALEARSGWRRFSVQSGLVSPVHGLKHAARHRGLPPLRFCLLFPVCTNTQHKPLFAAVGTKPQELTFPTTISKEVINDLPLSRFDGPIELIHTQGQLNVAVAELKKEKILGFDTETRPSFKRGRSYPPALLQLGGAEKVYLFQLQRLEDISPVLEVLANPDIVKVGVAIRDDVRKLREMKDFYPAGFVELADITQKADIVNTGLRSLAGIFLGVRISKGAQVSNWSRDHLTEAQTVYAATDAWISREIYIKLLDLGMVDEY